MTRTDYWKMPLSDIYSSYLDIAELLIEKANTSKQRPSRRRVFQHEMYVKFVYHLASIMTLEQGSIFSKVDPRKRTHDYSSVVVLLRAALETFLTYYYVFCDLTEADELDFRYYNWLVDGLGFRQRIDVSFSKELLEKQARERAEIDDALTRIRQTATFGALSEKQKRVVTEKLQWIRPGWSEVLIRAGFDEYWSRVFYALYSTYAHTSSQSIIQFRDATVRNEGSALSSAFANLVHIAAAQFTEYYMKAFAFGGSLSAQQVKMLEAWIWMGAHLKK